MKRLFIILSIIVLAITACAQATEPPIAENTADTPTETPTNVIVKLVSKTNTPKPATATKIAPTATPSPSPIATPKAKPIGIVNGDLVNLRESPSLNAAIIGSATLSQSVTIIGKNDASDWWQITTDDDTHAWISAEFINTDATVDAVSIAIVAPTPTLAPSDDLISPTDSLTQSVTGIVNGDLVNLRESPNLNAAIVGSATENQNVTIVGKTAESDWYEVCCLANSTDSAWIFADLVDTDSGDNLPVTAENAEPPAATEDEAPPAPVAVAAPDDINALPADGGFGRPTGGTDPLTNLAREVNSLSRPVIVCINNDPQARPQYGIGSADVMYEYLMEGYSITRFSGIFFGSPPAQIGPIRSARLVNYYMGALYNAPLFCSGASDDVRYMLKNFAPFPYLDVDLDDPSNTRYSVSANNDYRTRLRTGNAGLSNWLSNWDIETPGGLRGFTFGDLAGGGTPATQISIDYPAVTGSNVDYTFDAASGQYLRFLGDDPHLDGNTGEQVSVANVIVQVIPHEETDMVEDSLGNKGIRLNLFSGGQSILFRDGQAFVGSWRSSNRGDTPHFFNQNGTEIPLKAGHTWISIVTALNDVTFGE